jgi:uncharacterized integral membrane protein (TIGR00697 family)
MTRATLTALFTGSIVLANILAAKLTWIDLPAIGGVAIPSGFIAFGLAYLASDLLVEFHGREYATRVVNGTVLTMIVAWGLVYLAVWFPTAPFYEGQKAFESVLGSSASIILASVIALAGAQHLDVRLFARLKQRTKGQHRWLRNCGSTVTSQLADTVMFISLGFAVFPSVGLGGDPMWGWSLVSIIVGQYIVKIGVALLDTPVFYVVTEIQDRDYGADWAF